MPIYVYVRVDDIRRSLETSSNSRGPSIGPARRDFLPVTSYTGTQINVPLKYLGATAVIEVTGDEQCSVDGSNMLLVYIRNGVDVSNMTRGKIRSELTTATKGAVGQKFGKKIGDGVKEIVQTSGAGQHVFGKARNAVHGKIHSSLTKVGKSVGASFKTTQSITNFASKHVGKAATAGITKGISAGLTKIAPGTSIAAALLESTDTGMDASRYDRSYTGKASDGTGATFFVKGAAD